MNKAEADHPVAGEGQVYCVVRKGEVLKIRKFWSDAHGWQRKLPGSTVEVRKEADVKKPDRAAKVKKKLAKPKAVK